MHRKRAVWRAEPGFAQTVSLLAIGFTLMQAVSWSVVNGAYLLANRYGWLWPGASVTQALLLNDGAIYLAGLPFLLLLGRLVPSGAPLPLAPVRPLSLSCFARLGCVCYAAVYLANILSLALLALFRLLFKQPVLPGMVNSLLDGTPPLTALLLVALLPAVCEELVFRGYLYKKLIRFGEGPYILLSGFFFGTFHGNPEQALYAFALGCCLAFLVCRTGSVVYGVLLHFTINFFSSCVLLQLAGDSILTALLGVGLLGVIGLGIGFFTKMFRGLRFKRTGALPRHPVAAALLNPGMLTWIILFALLVCLTLIN